MMLREAVLALLLLAGKAQAYGPPMPYLSFSLTCTGATASISVSHYVDAYTQYDGTTTAYVTVGPIKTWSVSIVEMTAATVDWTAKLQVSNDDATWWDLMIVDSRNVLASSMTWADHRTARRARLYVTRIATGTLTGTAYGEP